MRTFTPAQALYHADSARGGPLTLDLAHPSPRLVGAPALIPQGSHLGAPPLPLRRTITVIGSRPTAHLYLRSNGISRAHGLIINADGEVYFRDLHSRTHSYLNGEPVSEATLHDGDLLAFQGFTLQFSAGRTRKMPTEPAPATSLSLRIDRSRFEVRQRSLVIGRRPGCDLEIADDRASAVHAVIFRLNGRYFVLDLNSSNGTLVNDELITQTELHAGDSIVVGSTIIECDVSQAAAEDPEDVAPVPDVPVLSATGSPPVALDLPDEIEQPFGPRRVRPALPPDVQHRLDITMAMKGIAPAPNLDDADDASPRRMRRRPFIFFTLAMMGVAGLAAWNTRSTTHRAVTINNAMLLLAQALSNTAR